jgi:leucyl/phenylalanyl-tRNA--protein transferase
LVRPGPQGGIIPLDDFHIPGRLARRLRRNDYKIRFDTAFRAVITACAEPGPGREATWINEQIINTYCELHEAGYAHSVETWMDGELVGGLYGVSLRGLFAGESMFSRVTDSSKVALVYLVRHLQRRRFVLLDTQFITGHLRRFGAVEISRREYKRRLDLALRTDTNF